MPTIDESVERAARAIFTQSNVNLGNAPNDFAWEDADPQCLGIESAITDANELLKICGQEKSVTNGGKQ